MGFHSFPSGFSILSFLFAFSFISSSFKPVISDGTVYIDGKSSIGRIDNDFICATLDWWPPEKCDYGTCSWGHASLLNLDLSNIIFLNAIKAFSPLKIRLGGTLQDNVIYQTEDHHQPCNQFIKNTTEVFGYTQGCLPLNRWDELNAFFSKSGAVIIFGLNALNGRNVQRDKPSLGAWDYTNAKSLIEYTVKKGYQIHGWELGNELSGDGVGTRVYADQYAVDTISLRNVVQEAYKYEIFKPLVIAPGGFFKSDWVKEFIDKTPGSLDVLTHHIYNLGPGVDEHLIDKILDPSVLDGEASTFSQIQILLKNSPNSATSWVGESGGAYNSGHNLVTNAFVFSFWYLDQLGMAATYDTKTYCRQSLIGGNYGLLNTTTFVPNPDYYSALLWHRLMGRNVLSTSFSGTKKIRAYAHCSKLSQGVVLLLINLDNSTTVETSVSFNGSWAIRHKHRSNRSSHDFHHRKRVRLSESTREEYHLTAKDGSLHSQIMLLNGKALMVDSYGNIPVLDPIIVNATEEITVAPFSIVFSHLPYVNLPACR
ncbi:heparanase-like protein 3 [Impatiens glandulifera]|uniref:heparanase-like protein 3 n=1 Tax=Impatiens glandulifera TaxID=253017 RepID=UPI001FB165A0|nr:heparanase-like protein 3 [Impatiens glandulifera]XP_047339135.1 heparanase-like protein 3 [Impatiens glandulifera]